MGRRLGYGVYRSAGASQLALRFAPWRTVVTVSTLGLIGLAGATGLLAADIWLPAALPLLALPSTALFAYTVRYVLEERSRQRIEHAFGHYLSPTLVARLAAAPEALKLGGRNQQITVMFADLSGFTALSGQMAPEVLVYTTNQYLGYIVEQVEPQGGMSTSSSAMRC